MKGSFTEELINRTIDWYWMEGIALFKKSHIPISIKNREKETEWSSIITEKGDIDYYGVYKGKYISFEVKETKKNYFSLKMIRPHQLEILLKLKEHSAISFLLVNFLSKEDSIFAIKAEKLSDLIDLGVKGINHEKIKEIGIQIPISQHGIIDFLSYLPIDQN